MQSIFERDLGTPSRAIASKLEGSTVNIVSRLAIGMTLERDTELLRAFVAGPDGRRTSLLLGDTGPTVFVNDAGVCGTAVGRPEEQGRDDEYVFHLESAKSTLFDSFLRTNALSDAESLIAKLLHSPDAFKREDAMVLSRWRDLIAVDAYM